jgi:DNA-nicking Smr family endonuclease
MRQRASDNRMMVSHDRAVWAEAMRDVTPLRGRGASRAPGAPSMPTPITEELLPKPTGPRPREPGVGIDRASAERLKRGLRPIEARLDLHGRSLAEAHRDLFEFIEASHRDGRRCLLVITGRGLGPDGPGVLKSAVPRWLAGAGLRRRVLAVAAAQPRHGGAGALYVLLRRQRQM